MSLSRTAVQPIRSGTASYYGTTVEVVSYRSEVSDVKVNGVARQVRTALLTNVQFADTPSWRDPPVWNPRTGR
jgi:hypothetical protein